jgi:hypothetical protein
MALQRQFLNTILPPFYPIILGWWGLFFVQRKTPLNGGVF